MRSPPSAVPAAASTAERTSSSSVTSALTKPAFAPSSSASAFPRSSLTSAIVITAPASCSRRTVASPRPDAPPTTSAALPSIRMDGTLFAARLRQRHREQVVRVGVQLVQVQPRGGEVGPQARRRELGADLGPQLLALGELNLQVQRSHLDQAVAGGAQPHLHPLAVAIEERHVIEVLGD